MPPQRKSRAKTGMSSLPRSVHAYQFLRSGIENYEIEPGTRLLEVELANQLGMSRTPIREALNQLESDGLITNEPGNGLVVTQLDQSGISELYEMREVLEGTAARMAARHASEIELALLREVADRDELLLGDHKKLAGNNKTFHEALYQCAHNRHLSRSLRTIQGSVALLGLTSLAAPGRMKIAVQEHQNLVKALEGRDGELAESIMKAHIRGAYRARLFSSP